MGEKPERRNFLKYAATAIVAGVVAGVGGYFGYAATIPAGEKTVTVTPTPTVTTPTVTTPTVGKGWEWEKEHLPDKLYLAYDFAACETPFFGTIAQDVFHNEEILESEPLPERISFGIMPCESVAELRETIHAGHAKMGFCAYEFFPVVDSFGDMYYSNGLHTGCIVSCVSNELWDQGVQDEKSFLEWVRKGVETNNIRKINVGQYGNSPFWLLSVMLYNGGLDPRKDIEVTVTDPASVPAAMKAGKMDAAFEWDPIPRIVEWEGAGHIMVDQGIDPPYCEQYCCLQGVNKTFFENFPITTRKLIKGVMEYGLYVKYYPHEAAKDYISFGPELCPYKENELVEMYAHYRYDIMSNEEKAYTTFQMYWSRMYEMGYVIHDTDWAYENGYRHIEGLLPTGTMTEGRVHETPEVPTKAYGGGEYGTGASW
jgi:ABC-type nitrate/sulfonate/bicarbonate transport system substrate-binding protein